jgi:uncharacterized protein YjbI with pentapeptide repeats
MKGNNTLSIQAPRLPKPMPTDGPETLADHVHIFQSILTGQDYSGLQANGVILEQVRVRKVQFLRAKMHGFRVVDSILETSEFSGGDWEKAFYRRVIFQGCRLLGPQMLEATFEDVEFINCQAEGILMVSTKFKNCLFSKCNLKKASFDEADLSGVIFDDCDLSEANFHEAKLAGTDFRTSVIGGLQVGVKEMQGAIIAPHQVLQVVGLLGVRVKDIEHPDESQ